MSASRTVVITGGNAGIGKAAVARFAAAGHRVVMACRDVAKGERAAREVAPGTAVDVRELDVSSFASVRAFCAGILRDYERLDILIHNAAYLRHGVRQYQRSVDGLELSFATNVFGPLLLTESLLEPLARSDDPRILTAGTTNLLNFFDPRRSIEWDNLRGEHADDRPYSTYKMYGDSKMGLLLLTQRMAARYAARGIKANCVMIPTVRSEKESLKKFSSWFRLIGPVVQYWNPFALSREQMAASYHHICTAGAFRSVTGALVDHRGRILPPLAAGKRLSPPAVLRELVATRHAPPYAADPANEERMWALAEEVCGLPTEGASARSV